MRYIGWILAALVLVATAVWQPTVAGFGGAVAGLLLELAVVQLGLGLGAVLFGLRVTHVLIGVGGQVREWTSPHRRVVLRALPVLATVGIAGERSPVRLRTVNAGITSAIVATTTVAATWLTSNLGLALAATAVLVHELIPVRRPGHTSVGWFVFALPTLSGRPLAEMESAPRVTRGLDAYNAGDLETAERIAAELTAEHPELLMVTGLRTATLCGRNRYSEALHLVSGLVGRPDLQPREMAFVLASMAALTAQAVDAGQLPAELGTPTAKRTIDGAIKFGYPAYRADGTHALIALLEGDTTTAIDLGHRSAEANEHAVNRADDLTTVAKAHMANGDNAKAREVMAVAHELAGWFPRVANTKARLEIA